MIARRSASVLWWLLLVLAACAPPASQVAPSSPEAPRWDVEAFEEHVAMLHAVEQGGRVLGGPAYARAATYVRDRLRAYGVQPGIEGRLLVSVPTRRPTTTRLTVALLDVEPGAAAVDTLRLVPGLDVAADGRTDGVRLTARTVTLAGTAGTAGERVEPVVLLAAERATDERLRALRAQGAVLVLAVGTPAAPEARPRVRGLGVVGVGFQAAARLLDVPGGRLRAILEPETPTRFALPRPLYAEVAVAEVDYEVTHAMGFVAGRHPVLADELVLVCTDLEAPLPHPDLEAVDFRAVGEGTAALLETAGALTRYARFSNVPERSVLFAVWMGPAGGPSPLARYLRAPLWALDRTRAVVYVGASRERAAELEALLRPHGIALHVVEADPSPYDPATALRPVGPARRRAERDGRAPFDPAAVDLDALTARSATRALHQAARLHDLVLREAMTDRGS